MRPLACVFAQVFVFFACFTWRVKGQITAQPGPDPCLSDPCENGGTCQTLATSGFKCLCSAGYEGQFCETGQLPRLVTRLEEINKTEKLMVNCTFPRLSVVQNEIQTLLSLIITKKPLNGRDLKEEELASIHIKQPAHVNLLSSSTTSSGLSTATSTSTATTPQTAAPTSFSGRMNAYINKRSYLSLTWNSPNSTEEGLYACVVQGLDNIGHLVTMTSSSVVTRGSELEEFQKSLDRVRQTIQQSQNCCISLRQRLASLEWTYKRLRLALGHIEKNLMMAPYEEYMTHKYYISKFPVKRFSTGEAVCEALGGYLVEITDSGENKAVEAMLKAAKPNLNFYYMGAQDAEQESQWYWVRNHTKMTYNAWPITEPNNLGNEDCLEWWVGHGWNDEQCTLPSATRGFLCEV